MQTRRKLIPAEGAGSPHRGRGAVRRACPMRGRAGERAGGGPRGKGCGKTGKARQRERFSGFGAEELGVWWELPEYGMVRINYIRMAGEGAGLP